MKVLMGTRQFKMVIDEELVDRLRSTAEKTGRDSAQHLAEEIITIYLPVYSAVFDATRRAVNFQSQQSAGKVGLLATEITLTKERKTKVK